MIDCKKMAATEAAKLIEENMIVGLGDGSTIAYVAESLFPKLKDGMKLTMVTSSDATKSLLANNGVTVHPTNAFAEIDLYLDGCDEFDRQLNALKSGGGIHTREKLLAAMAKKFYLVGEAKKYVPQFNASIPLVIEVLKDAIEYVRNAFSKKWPQAKIKIREKDGAPVCTYDGNLLLDVWFNHWPQPAEVMIVTQMPGVVEISLFYQMAHGAIIADENGTQYILPS